MRKILPIIHLASQFATVQRALGYREGHVENDAEHSFQLALVCWSANEQYQLGFNEGLIMKFALVHDLVEVYAGDTDAHGSQAAIASKKEREHKAFEKLKQTYGVFEDLIKTIERYETKTDPEAQLVSIMDKLIPSAHVYFGKGDYCQTHKLSMDEWKHWINRKIKKESLHQKLQVFFEKSLQEIQTDFSEIFYRE